MKCNLPFPNFLNTLVDLSFIDVYAFYDRPLLFSAYDSVGEIYLINLIVKNSSTRDEEWLVAPITQDTLERIRSGLLNFRAGFLTNYTKSFFLMSINWSNKTSTFSSILKIEFDHTLLPISGEMLDGEEIANLNEIPKFEHIADTFFRTIDIEFDSRVYSLCEALLLIISSDKGEIRAVMSNSTKIFIEEHIRRDKSALSIYFTSMQYINADLIYSFNGRQSSFGIADTKTLSQTTTALNESHRIAAAGIAKHCNINPLLLSPPILQDVQRGSIKYLITANQHQDLKMGPNNKDANFTTLDLTQELHLA